MPPAGQTRRTARYLQDGSSTFDLADLVDGEVLGRVGGILAAVLPSTVPSGAAGGDLGGTYPNPSVEKVKGTVPSTFGLARLADADAAATRLALSLVVGTNVQAYDAGLAALAGVASNGLLARTGAGTAAARTLTGAGVISVANGDGVSGNPAVSFVAPWNPSTMIKWIVPGGTLTAGVGCSINTSGTVAFDSSDATGPMVRFGNSTSGGISGLVPGTGTAQVLQTRWGYTIRLRVRTHSDLTSQRLWVGVGNAGASYNSDTPANDIAALRFSTVAGDTTWKLYTSILAGANAVTDTGVTVVADTDYEIIFTVTATSVSVSINGGSATTYNGANVPSSTAALSFIAKVIPQVASVRYLHFRGCSCQPT